MERARPTRVTSVVVEVSYVADDASYVWGKERASWFGRDGRSVLGRVTDSR